METALTINPETNKPNPISIKEWYVMDQKAQRQFAKSLSIKEQMDFSTSLAVEAGDLPKEKRLELLHLREDMLQKKEKKSLGDRIDLKVTRSGIKRLEEDKKPPKPPKESKFLQKARAVSSPYLIKSV